MAPNRITRSAAALRAPSIPLACLVLALAFSACGGAAKTVTVTSTSGPAPANSGEVDEEADAKLVNQILTRQTAAVAADEETLPHLHGRAHAAAQLFAVQEQEHIDGLLKALRALGEGAEPGSETIAASGLRSQADRLRFLYEVEAATLQAEISAIAGLTSPTARSTLTATVANQAQHLTLLRTLLGANLAASVPLPFENGTAAAP